MWTPPWLISCYDLDFFAAFGTTGHAVINLNREDGGRRKVILAACRTSTQSKI